MSPHDNSFAQLFVGKVGQASVNWVWVPVPGLGQQLPSPPLRALGSGEKAVDDAGAGDNGAGGVEVGDVALVALLKLL